MGSNEAEIWYVTLRGAVEATLWVSEYLEAIEAMTKITQPLLFYHTTSPIYNILLNIRAEMLTLVFQLQSKCVIPIFDSTEPQESDYDIVARVTERGNAL